MCTFFGSVENGSKSLNKSNLLFVVKSIADCGRLKSIADCFLTGFKLGVCGLGGAGLGGGGFFLLPLLVVVN